MPQHLDIASLENDLRLESQQPYRSPGWLEDSYRNSGDFWRSLQGAFDAHVAVQGTSSLFNGYNFYHDMLIRNRNRAQPALCWYEPATGIKGISYRELDSLAAARSSHWARLGVLPGQTICIIRTMGLEMTVDLLAALKAGCVISFLPPRGRGFLQRRLDVLKPDHIAMEDRQTPLLPTWNRRVLPEGDFGAGFPNGRERPFTYRSGRIIFRHFDPCGSDPGTLSDVTSDSAYLCALRDAMISLGIGPGQIYAAPGFHAMETTPALLLAGLLCGATYLHLTPKDIEAQPELVRQHPLKAFGVCPQVRDILLEKQISAEDCWESWFRNPAESQDMDRWYHFIRNLKLERSFAFNLRWSAAVGGCSLFSVRRKGSAHMTVLPVPGSTWSLGALSGAEEASAEDFGVYTLSATGAPEEEQKATADRIARSGQEWIFSGVSTRHREGRTFPVDEILTTLRKLEARYGFFCSLADVPRMDGGNGQRMVLLVFRGADAQLNEARVTSEIRTTLAEEMGEEFLPDRMEFLPLSPRFLSPAEVDHSWCRNAFLSGTLSRRSKREVFAILTRLRKCVIEQEHSAELSAGPADEIIQ